MLMRSTQKLSQVIGLQIWWSLLVKVDLFQKMLSCSSDPQTFVQKHCSLFFSFSWFWILPLTFWLFKKSTNVNFKTLNFFYTRAQENGSKFEISYFYMNKVHGQWFHTKVWGSDEPHNLRRYFQLWCHPQKNQTKSLAPNFSTLHKELRNSDLVHFFEDATKSEIPSKITKPLANYFRV